MNEKSCLIPILITILDINFPCPQCLPPRIPSDQSRDLVLGKSCSNFIVLTSADQMVCQHRQVGPDTLCPQTLPPRMPSDQSEMGDRSLWTTGEYSQGLGTPTKHQENMSV